MAIFKCVGFSFDEKKAKKKSRKKQRSRILQAYENKTSYTLEDGHVG
jgi:hypothetical protein